jgi:hypothetical protein
MPLVICLPPRCFKRRLAQNFRRRYHLPIIEDTIQVRWGSEGDQNCLIADNRGPLREFKTPLEVSHDHFLVTPPSHPHFAPQKFEGFVVGLIGNGRESMAETLDHAENIVKGNFTHFIY